MLRGEISHWCSNHNVQDVSKRDLELWKLMYIYSEDIRQWQVGGIWQMLQSRYIELARYFLTPHWLMFRYLSCRRNQLFHAHLFGCFLPWGDIRFSFKFVIVDKILTIRENLEKDLIFSLVQLELLFWKWFLFPLMWLLFRLWVIQKASCSNISVLLSQND
jgi:hypothetical protein